jgi:hypothetical protein
MVQIRMSDLFNNPDLYFFGLENDNALFLPMNRQSYARSIFFDARIKPLRQQIIRVPLAALLVAMQQRKHNDHRVGWVFHMAHTGSTLLTRALDRPGKNLVIREPMPLRALGVAVGAANGNAPVDKERLQLAVAMLGRRYADDQSVIVKANVPVNAIVPDLLMLSENPAALLLHFGLDDYLTAILRSPKHRKWVSHVSAEIRLGECPETGPVDTLHIAELGAALWLFQMRIYVTALEKTPSMRSLDANILFDEPAACLTASSRYFCCPICNDEVQQIVSSELFSTYAKNPGTAFNNSLRRARVAENRRALADEIALARRWIEPRLSIAPLPDRLPAPLYGENSLLF